MDIYIAIFMSIAILIVFILQIAVANKNKRKHIDNEIVEINEFKGINNNEDNYSYDEKYEKIKEIYSDKGKVEEYHVFKKIKRDLEGNFEIFGPVRIFKNKDKKDTTEIDITIIHEVGIFIIEVKNLFGQITGEINEQYWNQKLNSKIEYDFYNPILQNKAHIYHFKKIIDTKKYNLENSDIYSIVVFGNDSMINSVRYEDDNLKIVNTRQVVDILNNIIRNKEYKLSDNDIQDICCLYKNNIKLDDEIEQNEISSVNNKITYNDI